MKSKPTKHTRRPKRTKRAQRRGRGGATSRRTPAMPAQLGAVWPAMAPGPGVMDTVQDARRPVNTKGLRVTSMRLHPDQILWLKERAIVEERDHGGRWDSSRVVRELIEGARGSDDSDAPGGSGRKAKQS